MTVEQTTQLIQLILNSVLLTVVCALALGRLVAKSAAIEEQLQATNYRYADLLDAGGEAIRAGRTSYLQHRLTLSQKALRQLRQRYSMTRYSLLATHYAFLFSVISTFVLALRALLPVDWLIVVAIALFIVSVASLLLGVGLTLLELHSSNGWLWAEIGRMLNITSVINQPQSGSRRQSVKSSRRALRPATPSVRSPSRARVS